MITEFKNLTVGTKLQFNIPENVKDEQWKKYDKHTVEIKDIMYVFHPMTFDVVLKYIVGDVETGEEYALSGESYQFLNVVE